MGSVRGCAALGKLRVVTHAPVGGQSPAPAVAKPGTMFEELEDSWRCPQCQSPKPYFSSQTLTIAGAEACAQAPAPSSGLSRLLPPPPPPPPGFEENQQYGFGGNSMTESQKSNLIFGGLFVGFLLLMSGYLLT